MTELDKVIESAYASQGKIEDVNKVYITLLRTSLFIPCKKEHLPTEESPFSLLFTEADGSYFIMAFDTVERLKEWASTHLDKITYVELSGNDLIKGLNENVYLCLNFGGTYYKEFSPDEIKQLKKIVIRVEQLKQG